MNEWSYMSTIFLKRPASHNKITSVLHFCAQSDLGRADAGLGQQHLRSTSDGFGHQTFAPLWRALWLHCG